MLLSNLSDGNRIMRPSYRLWNSILLNLEDDGGAKYDRIQRKGRHLLTVTMNYKWVPLCIQD